jgi:ADP-heptose:LPS heptosyltransferase
VDRYLSALAPLGITAFPEEVRFPVTREAECEALSFLIGNRIDGLPLVAVVPGARQETKRWPVAHYRSVAHMARAEGYGVIVAGGPGEERLMRDVCSGLGEGVVAWDPAFPLDRLAAVLKHCRVVVSNDNGLMHLAAAVGTPVVALFGPTVPAFGFFPLGEGHRVLERDLPCRPCSLHGRKPCKINGRPCLGAITPAETWKAALEAISRAGG